MTEKVMSFNLRFDNPEDGENNWKYRSKQAGKMINRYEPLVVGTQEGLHSILEDLEEVLPKYSWIGKSRRGNLEDEFSAILYDNEKLTCVEHGQFWLSEEPDTPNTICWESALPRICTWGHFKFKEESNEEFLFFNTHLDHESEEARIEGTVLIWKRLQEQAKEKNLPVILTGDFNSFPENQVIQFLSGQLEVRGQQSELKNTFEQLIDSKKSTFHDFKGGDEDECIDYIFCTPNISVEKTMIDQTKIDGRYPSDHYPVISEINL